MNDSPSFFFHEEIPPSFIVGDIAGISILVIALRADVECNPTYTPTEFGHCAFISTAR